jgi:ribonuclease D
MQESPLIDQPNKLREWCERNKNEPMIALDTEFIRESTFYPELEWIQLATRTEAVIIDCRTIETETDLAPLKSLLMDQKVLKIIHAAYGDQECLWARFNFTANPVFDTAVGASLLGLGDSIGLGALTKQLLGIELPKGHARTNWGKRPLSPDLLEYALSDVRDLIRLADSLLKSLDSNGRRAWALEVSGKSADAATFDPSPEDLARKLSQSGRIQPRDYGILLAVMEWREERAKRLNIPRRWVADDGTVMDLTKAKPENLDQLLQFRGLSKGQMKGETGNLLLKAIQNGKGRPEPSSFGRSKERVLIPSAEESRGIELFKLLVQMLADEVEISAKHLLANDAMLKLIRNPPKNIDEMRARSVIPAEIDDGVAQRMVDFLQGNIAFALKQGKVIVGRMA